MRKDCFRVSIQVDLFKVFLIRDTAVDSAVGYAHKEVVVLVHIKVDAVDTILVSQLQVQLGG